MLHHQPVKLLVNGKQVQDSEGKEPCLYLVSVTTLENKVLQIALGSVVPDGLEVVDKVG